MVASNAGVKPAANDVVETMTTGAVMDALLAAAMATALGMLQLLS